MSDAGDRLSSADVQDLLVRTSRTFAVSIPLLSEPTRTEVGLAYLLFRIADTFEDAVAWPRAQRLAALAEFGQLLEGTRDDGAQLAHRWVSARPVEHDGYLELLALTPQVIASSRALRPGAWQIVQRHALRTVEGMARFAEASDEAGRVELGTLQDLRDYCYVVAGIVGELLTDLFVHDAPEELKPVRDELDRRAARFGEALQLVNIVKDASGDAEEGRTFLPADVALEEVFALARRDVETAKKYVGVLRTNGAPRGQVAFTALPLLLAEATLVAVERDGSGAKISREAVAAHIQALHATLEAGGDPFAASESEAEC